MPAKLIIGQLDSELATLKPRFEASGFVRKLGDREDALDFVNEIESLDDLRPILIYDLSDLEDDAAVLGRFLNSTNRVVVCLAGYDNLGEDLLTRFLTVKKHPYMYPAGDGHPDTIIEFFESGEEHKAQDTMRTIISCNPLFFETYNRFLGVPAFSKLVKLLGKRYTPER